MSKRSGRQNDPFARWGGAGQYIALLGLLVGISLVSILYIRRYNSIPIGRRASYSFSDIVVPLMLELLGVLAIYAVVAFLLYRRRRKKLRERMDALTHKGSDVTPEEFLKSGLYREADFTGIYILHNETKDEYYVGQSVHVLTRVRQHFTGHGNGDIYADWKYGDKFTITLTKLVDSGYDNLNDLERDAIKAYDAYDKGYNRTGGNAS